MQKETSACVDALKAGRSFMRNIMIHAGSTSRFPCSCETLSAEGKGILGKTDAHVGKGFYR